MLPDDPATTESTPGWQHEMAPVAPASPVVAASRGTPILALAIALVAILAGGALFMSGVLVGQRLAGQPGTPANLADSFQPFWDTYDTIERRYAGGDIDEQALVRGAIRGMVEALGDPYSSYLTPEEYQSGLQDLSGQFEGIGAVIGTKNTTDGTTDCPTLGPTCALIVVSPIEDSPADKAGLLADDVIVSVDGAVLDGLTVDAARDMVRGRKGTEVVLTLKRGDAVPFDVAIVRDVVAQQEVIQEDLAEGTIGYIRVTGFSDNAATQYHKALEADVKAGRKKLILDLRGNPGGYVTAAREIASEFITSGPLFWEQSADGKQEPTDAKSGGLATDSGIELIVLVDRGSASASEIVAGALQDRKRATIVGETTFGKGTVQQWIELPNTGALKLTIARWLTPDKRWINQVGIVPEVVVQQPAQPAPDKDAALDKAVEILGGAAALRPAA
jgi:carboxyl-terminal processing protease